MAAYASTIILICLAVLSYFVHNNAVTISILILLAIKLTPLATFFPVVEKQGIQVGIIILTVAVMAPLASGSLPASSLIKSFMDWKSGAAIIVGVLVAWLGARGVSFMSAQPSIIGGLLVGTVIGVAFFRGVPVGPLIAAGIVSLMFAGK
ncbi:MULTISPECIES: DUF441 domain-containing protein [Pantoea]|uniref:UPF0756 membrane protein F3J40_07250 n=1 Tax=Candidatus Pantoea multigeneris TaxID=2608357 RepID=A0ABX0R7S8_9GAMM|nr:MULTISPECIES: DUF441 domain-containing protein [Pantoea]NIF21396.1 DUF441 domain-containing protein [Pantoea multigeneris]